MKVRTRLLSAVLAAVMLFSLSVPAFATEGQETNTTSDSSAITGEIRATVRLDYAQNLKTLKTRDVRATLTKDGTIIGEFPLWNIGTHTGGQVYSHSHTVTAKYRDGGAMENPVDDSWPGYLELTVPELSLGTYTLTFEGTGYKKFFREITLGDYSQHLIVGTGDNTFSLGDINGDGVIDAKDLEKLANNKPKSDKEESEEEKPLSSEENLGKTGDSAFDLNGDGIVDVLDLAYVQRSIAVQGDKNSQAQLMDTLLLNPPVDEAATQAAITATGTTMEGQLSNLFVENAQGVRLTPPSDNSHTVQLPITFTEPKDMEQVIIHTPEDSTGAEKGSVLVEYSDGSKGDPIPFDATPPADVHAIGEIEGTRSITINLGKRVPVKKITISVTKTDDSYTVVESIQFLKDIVPENPVAPYRMVKNLKAQPGDGKISLKWSELPNVTGYRVEYWLKDSAEKKSLPVSKPYAEISGLKNGETYCFRVVPTVEDDDWTGDFCEHIEATPQPAKAPTPPEMITITELEGALDISWKKTESATYYQVFYKKKSDPDDAYQQVGGDLTETKVRITSLENEVTYSIYLLAGNNIGLSGRSRVMEGTPKAVKYDIPEGLPEGALLDRSKIKSIRLAAPNNYAKGEYTADQPFTANNLIDGKYDTHWTAANWSGNEHVICEFTEPVKLQAAFWCPRMDANYPKWIRAYSVQVWYEGEEENAKANKNGHLLVPDPNRGGVDNNGGSGGSDVHTWPNVTNYSTAASDRFAIMPFEADNSKGIIQISVAAEQAGYNLTSCSELHFMTYDPSRNLPAKIAALFADDLRTTLASGVDQTKITELKNELKADQRYYYNIRTMEDELALAEELLKGESSGKSVILEGIQSRSNGADSAKYGQSGSALQPLGSTATAGQEITVYASGIPAGETVTLYASQFNAEVSAWQAKIGVLQNGRNIFNVPKIGSQSTQRGGSLYLTYSGTKPEDIKLHVRRATDIPVLELANWYDLNESERKTIISAYLTELDAYLAKQSITDSNRTTNIYNVTEISTPVVLLSLPAAAVQNNNNSVQTIYNAIEAWEDLMHICKTTQGIDNTYEKNDMQSRQNIRCMQMFTGAFMYAAGNHIGIGYSSCAGMVHGRPLTDTNPSLYGWGIAHEVGHNMDKLGKAEITNNIYSIMVQTFDGQNNVKRSRLESSNKYAAAFNKVAQAYPGASNDVFVQLALYWQLHLAYDGAKAENPMAFYNQFFKAWKAGTYTQGFSNLSYDEKVALTASGVAGKDLSEFFRRWGMTLSKTVQEKLATYDKESRAIWYLNDQSRRDRLAGVTSQTAGFTAVAAKKTDSDTQIAITITQPNVGHIQGYEILRNNKAIGFLPAGETLVYTDEIGSGNHLTYHYQVVAYDTLGNQIGKADAGEVRIAYDKTVDPNAYTIERNGTTATITFHEETAISGLKLTGENRPTSGSFTVAITADEQGAKPVTARQSTFDEANNQAVDDKNSFLTYFNKPGTTSTDTRIWTYDAKTVVITGLPEVTAMANSDIQLVSYAGDDVGFYESANGFIGCLSADYQYTDENGAEQTIKAGTLVIVGTYRGDPVFNTIRIMGRFTETKVSEATEETENANEQQTVMMETTERPLDGEVLMFAEIPEDGQVSDISDGLFLFIPNVQKEAELQEASHCDGINLLPSQIKAQFYRTDHPEDTSIKRETAETLWVHSPGGTDLPTIILNQEAAK